jgi:ABC-type lipoprotein release transport system permease subunit
VKSINLIPLAAKYLFRYRRRYLFLFFALTFGFSIITLITSIKDGMYENVYNSAQSHYAGDIITMGYDQGTLHVYHLEKNQIDVILQTIEETDLKPSHIVQRTLFSEKGMLYYNGAAVRQKYIIGVDWENEKDFFSGLSYQEPPRYPLSGNDTVVLSAPVAKELGVHVGDSLILEAETRWGQKNTGVFIVGGIVDDSSIFGYYKCYISRIALNWLLLYFPDECSSVGIFFPSRRDIEKKRLIFHNALEKKIQTGPLVHDREKLAEETSKAWLGVKIYLLTMPVYLSEIADLLGAMNILAYFLFGMILVIIFVSAVVTYRLILYERTRELGTMRTLGFQEADLRHILVMENLGLGFCSLASGFILAALLSWAVQFLSLSWFPSLEIFMKNGKLTSLYLPKTIMTNSIAILCLLIFAVWIPAFFSSRKPLSLMLSGGDV